MKKLALILVACLGLAGCATEYEVSEPTMSQPAYGCVVVTDEYGEREVCNTNYYYVTGGVVYWDAHFGVWVGPGGYWRSGIWYRGYYPGFHTYYHAGLYHPHGYFHGGNRAGYYRHYGPGGFHSGGGFHGGFHGRHR